MPEEQEQREEGRPLRKTASFLIRYGIIGAYLLGNVIPDAVYRAYNWRNAISIAQRTEDPRLKKLLTGYADHEIRQMLDSWNPLVKTLPFPLRQVEEYVVRNDFYTNEQIAQFISRGEQLQTRRDHQGHQTRQLTSLKK